MTTHDFPMILRNVISESVRRDSPSGVYFGIVITPSPLKISVEQKLFLTEKQLVLTRNVTNFKTTETIVWKTEDKSGGSGDSSFASHNHQIQGTKEITINNALKAGEKVILLREQGGQKFIVLDRVGSNG